MDALFELLKRNAEAANAFGAIASAAAALLALIVSVVSVVISIWAAKSQRRHNELSVRPLAEITFADYEDSLWVKLRNHGTGPLIVTAVVVSDGSSTRPTILAWMPELANDRTWNNFTGEVHDRTLAPGGELVLLELTKGEDEVDFAQYRDPVRAALAPLVVTVDYTNIYNSNMPPRRKPLSWFGRHGAA